MLLIVGDQLGQRIDTVSVYSLSECHGTGLVNYLGDLGISKRCHNIVEEPTLSIYSEVTVMIEHKVANVTLVCRVRAHDGRVNVKEASVSWMCSDLGSVADQDGWGQAASTVERFQNLNIFSLDRHPAGK